MNSIATIGYTSNLCARDQKTINYFEFQAMLADQVSDRLHWYATIHPRNEEDAYKDASERLSLCVQSQLNYNDKVLVVGGDISGLCHMCEWMSSSEQLGIEGISIDDFKGFLSSTTIAQEFEAIRLSQGLNGSAIGLWWPDESEGLLSFQIPSSLKILYVPELYTKKKMSMLMSMLEAW